MTITKNEATKLWSRLRSNLLATEECIKKIIETKAWEPLGYNSFTEAWKSSLSDIKLSASMEAVVVYGMISDGATKQEVEEAIFGVGVKKVEEFFAAQSAGLSPEEASAHLKAMAEHSRLGNGIVVKAHTRKRPEARGELRLKGFTLEEIALWKAVANDRGFNADKWFTSIFKKAMKDVI